MLIGFGMGKAKVRGMQGLAWKAGYGVTGGCTLDGLGNPAPAIGLIAHERVSDMGHVDAYLVGAAGL